MNEDQFRQAFSKQALREQFRDQQRRKDEAMLHNMHQLAFGSSSAGSILSATTAANAGTLVPTAATNLYATSTAGVVSAQPYYKKEVDDASLFMDNNLKILAASPYATSVNNLHKIDDTSAISSKYAITEYFNILYYDNLLTPGSKCKYAINDTKNVVKHNNIWTQTFFENIVRHNSSFTIGKIAHKWQNLHEALIWLNLKTH